MPPEPVPEPSKEPQVNYLDSPSNCISQPFAHSRPRVSADADWGEERHYEIRRMGRCSHRPMAWAEGSNWTIRRPRSAHRPRSNRLDSRGTPGVPQAHRSNLLGTLLTKPFKYIQITLNDLAELDFVTIPSTSASPHPAHQAQAAARVAAKTSTTGCMSFVRSS